MHQAIIGPRAQLEATFVLPQQSPFLYLGSFRLLSLPPLFTHRSSFVIDDFKQMMLVLACTPQTIFIPVFLILLAFLNVGAQTRLGCVFGGWLTLYELTIRHTS